MVSIPYSEFQAIQEAKWKAETDLALMKQQISEQKISSSDKTLFEVSRAAIEIVRFAVANLPPESTVRWPTTALRVVATRLPSMPDAGPDDDELMITLKRFADECDQFETRGRALGTR
jgi:hypothetical protein